MSISKKKPEELKRVFVKKTQRFEEGKGVLRTYDGGASYRVPKSRADELLALGPDVAVPADDQNNPIEPERKQEEDKRAQRAKRAAEKQKRADEKAAQAKATKAAARGKKAVRSDA